MIRLLMRGWADKAGGHNRLTIEGKLLLQSTRAIERFDAVRALGLWTPMAQVPLLRVAVSHSLLTSQILAPAIARFMDQYEGQVRLQIRLRTEMDFAGVLRDIDANELDLAISWNLPQRQPAFGGIQVEVLGPAFDAVLISYDQRFLKELHTDGKYLLDRLASRRLVLMNPANQPFMDELPRPNPSQGGERIEVDTMDAVIACVRSRLGEYGLIPALYAELDRFRQLGQLCYSKPVRTLTLATFALSSSLREPVRTFVRTVHDHLVTVGNRPAMEAVTASADFPRDAEFYERFNYAYYVDHERGNGQADPPATQWRWERVRLRRERDATSVSSRTLILNFSGVIENCYADRFTCRAELHERMFCVKATRITDTLKSVESFVAVLTWCRTDAGEALMYGTWSGQDPSGRPAAYATLWSERRLEIRDVHEIARHAMLSSSLNADAGYRFDTQPTEKLLG